MVSAPPLLGRRRQRYERAETCPVFEINENRLWIAGPLKVFFCAGHLFLCVSRLQHSEKVGVLFRWF